MFRSLKRDCPSCEGQRKDCRTGDKGLIHCRSATTPIGYQSIGEDSQGFNMYKIAEEPANVEGVTIMPIETRDTQYRNIRSHLTTQHKAELIKRGITAEQVEWCHDQGWIRSWEPGQSTKADRKTPGIDPKTGKTLGVKGIAIAAMLNGQITGYQIANDDRNTAKYIWLSSGNQDGSSPHVQGGDLPLAVWQHPTVQPSEVIICEGFLKSMITAIQFWAAGQTEYLVVGAAGGQFGASANTLRGLLNQHSITSVLLAPDAGSIANPQIVSAYERAKSVCAGRSFNVLWWGQETKEAQDIDELGPKDRKAIELISWDEFKALAPELKTNQNTKEKKSNSPNVEILWQILERCDLWQTEEHDPWIDLPIAGHKEPVSLQSPSIKNWLAAEFHSLTGRFASSDTIAQAIGVLLGQSRSAPTYKLYHRTARINGKIYLDLGRPDWQMVEICGAGWRMIEGKDCPAKFRRPKSMKELPMPEQGGDWQGLRKIVNLDEHNWSLLLAWLSWCFFPERPHPLLLLNGEQGTGKSKLSELLKRLIDPSKALLMSLPREERSLKAHAQNRWTLVYDNLSGLSGEMSDALCRLATGGGLVDRSLYTDMDESVFDGVRPIILNGIEALATRPDLLERSVLLNLTPITEEERITEEEWEQTLTANQPAIFGCLLNAVAQGLNNRENISLFSLPRMADFAIWGHATETAFGFAAGTFEDAYSANRGLVHAAAIDNDAIATALLQLAEKQTLTGRLFLGTASELLKALNDIVSEEQRKSPDWIKSPRVLGRRLVRLAPELRKLGIAINTGIRSHGQRLITLDVIAPAEPPLTEEEPVEEVTYEFEEESPPPREGEE
jgi:hypothetical protein